MDIKAGVVQEESHIQFKFSELPEQPTDAEIEAILNGVENSVHKEFPDMPTDEELDAVLQVNGKDITLNDAMYWRRVRFAMWVKKMGFRNRLFVIIMNQFDTAGMN